MANNQTNKTIVVEIDLGSKSLGGAYKVPPPRTHRGPVTAGAVSGISRKSKNRKGQKNKT